MSSPFTSTLLRWFRDNGRELPWRGTRDPYAVWLSEIILQQTQVRQGWEYWERFISRWPDVRQLAAASEDEVLRQWQGLGYYSRARNLLAAARQVVAMGGFPQTLDGLRGLKGVGDYTAAAIGSIAFGLPAAAVDGNVYRVLSRHFGISTPINSTEGKHEFAALAQSLMPQGKGTGEGGDAAAPTVSGLFNQALMDFGATLCTPKSPRCVDCPLADSCIALRQGTVAKLPVKLRKTTVKERRLVYIYIRYAGATALRRRGAGDIWQGLWEPLLAFDSLVGPSPRGDTATGGGATVPLPSGDCQLLCQGYRHVLTHRILLADFYLWEPRQRPSLPAGYKWIGEADIDTYALPRLVEQLFRFLPPSLLPGAPSR